jgi:hypothetical protein
MAHLTQQPEALQPVLRLAHETHFRHTTFDVAMAWIIQQCLLGMDKQHQVGIVLLSNYGDASVGNYDLDAIGFTLLEELTHSSG